MALYDELTTGPLATEIAPHITSGDDRAILEILNRKDIPSHGKVSTNEFVIWAAANGQRAVIEDTANDTASPLRSVAIALQDFVRGNLAQGLDFGRAETLAMAQAWQAAGKITQAQYDELLALSATFVSRADQLGYPVSIESIAKALRE